MASIALEDATAAEVDDFEDTKTMLEAGNACGGGDPRIKPKKTPGVRLRADLPDPTKPEFERDEAHMKLLESVQHKLDKVEGIERMDTTKVQLKAFNVAQLQPDYTCILIGKRREGKSYAMRYFLFSLRDQLPRGYGTPLPRVCAVSCTLRTPRRGSCSLAHGNVVSS